MVNTECDTEMVNTKTTSFKLDQRKANLIKVNKNAENY